MDLRKTLTLASSTLQAAGIEHALIGGFALATFGINRATADVDFIADGASRELILERLASAGFVLNQASAEVLQFAGVGLLDILLANRPLSLRMIREARAVPGLPVRVLRAEDIIGLKIQAYCNDRGREFSDKADILSLLRTCPDLDFALITEYADLFGEASVITSMRANA